MKKPEPCYNFWQVAEKWANELNEPVVDTIQRLRRYSTYAPDGSCPSMVFWPTAFFDPKGEINHIRVANVTRHNKDRKHYWTKELESSLEFMDSAYLPPEPTQELKNLLTQLSIRREDFERGCISENQPLPKFWFKSDSEELVQKDERSSASEAAIIMKKQQTAESDMIVDAIMEKIKDGVMDIVRNHRAERVINHIRFIREANVPDGWFDRVKTAVASQIKKHYGEAGFRSLSRAPKKKVEPYFLEPLK